MLLQLRNLPLPNSTSVEDERDGLSQGRGILVPHLAFGRPVTASTDPWKRNPPAVPV